VVFLRAERNGQGVPTRLEIKADGLFQLVTGDFPSDWLGIVDEIDMAGLSLKVNAKVFQAAADSLTPMIMVPTSDSDGIATVKSDGFHNI